MGTEDRLDQIAEVVRAAIRVADWADTERNELFPLHPCCLDRDAAPDLTARMVADLGSLVSAVATLRAGAA